MTPTVRIPLAAPPSRWLLLKGHCTKRRFLGFGILALLTLLAAWLRFSAIGFGLPEQYRPDEEKIIPAALDFKHDWNPHLAIYPAAQTYLTHVVLRTYASLHGAGDDLHRAFAADNQAEAYLIGREIVAAMGTLTVPAIYLAAAPAFGVEAGLAAAAIVAVSFIHVHDSKFVKDEVPAGLWLVLCIAMMLRMLKRGRSLDYGLAGVLCGLAAATHYTAGAIAIGILVAHLEAGRRTNKSLFDSFCDPKIHLAAGTAIFTFLCADPYFLLDWPQTKQDYALLRNYYLRFNDVQGPYNFGWHWLLLRAMPAGLGVELEIFQLTALGWVLIRPRPGTYAILAFILACFLGLTSAHPWLVFRYLVNPLIAMALLGGVMAADLVAFARSRIGPRAGYLMTVPLALLLIPSLVRDLQSNHLLGRTDTRTLARIWMLGHIPPGARVALIHGDSYGKPKLPGWYNLIRVDSEQELENALKTAQWVISDSFPPLPLWSKGATEAQLAELNSKGTLEFAVTSLRSDYPLPECDPNDAFYAPFTHITSMLRPGPGIRIWKIMSPVRQTRRGPPYGGNRFWSSPSRGN